MRSGRTIKLNKQGRYYVAGTEITTSPSVA